MEANVLRLMVARRELPLLVSGVLNAAKCLLPVDLEITDDAGHVQRTLMIRYTPQVRRQRTISRKLGPLASVGVAIGLVTSLTLWLATSLLMWLMPKRHPR